MFRALFATFFFAVGVMAIAMMMLGMCEDPTAGPKIVVAAPVPLTEQQQRVEGAHSRDATLFQYMSDAEGMALCNGTKRLLNLDRSIKEFRLTSQEADNLILCKYNSATGNYEAVQNIAGTLPGDWLVWDGDGLHDAKYTPR